MKKSKFISLFLILLFNLNCTSSSKAELSYEYCCPSNDTLLEDIQGKIQKAFQSSIVSGDPQFLGELYDELENLRKDEPHGIITYWMAYSDYFSSITALQHENRSGAEFFIDRAIDNLREMKEKNSEDYALLAMCQGFGIQFKGIRAMFISRQIAKNLEKAISLDPNNLRAYYVAGSNDFYTPEQYGGGKKVEEYILKALELEDQAIPNPYLPRWGRDLSYETLLAYYMKHEDWDKAKTLFVEARKLFPNSYRINQMAATLVEK